ncbi:MAG: hypothetical protein V4437_02570 [Patescibacteria group bacterium]
MPENRTLDNIPTSLFQKWPEVPHYHGDEIRKLFVTTAVISSLAIPIWGNLLPFGLLVELGGALALVLLAGLTNPHSVFFALLNTAIAGAGTFFLETSAIYYYHSESFMLFAIREVCALLLLFSFYYSVKTLRAMLLRQVGHQAPSGEFDPPEKSKK